MVHKVRPASSSTHSLTVDIMTSPSFWLTAPMFASSTVNKLGRTSCVWVLTDWGRNLLSTSVHHQQTLFLNACNTDSLYHMSEVRMDFYCFIHNFAICLYCINCLFCLSKLHHFKKMLFILIFHNARYDVLIYCNNNTWWVKCLLIDTNDYTNTQEPTNILNTFDLTNTHTPEKLVNQWQLG